VLIDSHCHLADTAFATDLEEVVSRARAAGLSGALCILSADEPEELARTETVLASWPEIRFAAGVHPHRAAGFAGRPEDAASVTREALRQVGGVAVGEIGLDYHYDFSPRDVQLAVFAAQVVLAVELDLPVVIHTREAPDDTQAVLRDVGAGKVRGVMHCFTGSLEEARQALDLGFFISIAGIVTFPRGENLREIARFVPVDRLLVETDAPFLAPVPHRGKRNEPAWVAKTLEAVAAVRGTTPEALAAQVADNFSRFAGVAETQPAPSPGVAR
jgi:TatD DNase family protein